MLCGDPQASAPFSEPTTVKNTTGVLKKGAQAKNSGFSSPRGMAEKTTFPLVGKLIMTDCDTGCPKNGKMGTNQVCWVGEVKGEV